MVYLQFSKESLEGKMLLKAEAKQCGAHSNRAAVISTSMCWSGGKDPAWGNY